VLFLDLLAYPGRLIVTHNLFIYRIVCNESAFLTFAKRTHITLEKSTHCASKQTAPSQWIAWFNTIKFNLLNYATTSLGYSKCFCNRFPLPRTFAVAEWFILQIQCSRVFDSRAHNGVRCVERVASCKHDRSRCKGEFTYISFDVICRCSIFTQLVVFCCCNISNIFPISLFQKAPAFVLFDCQLLLMIVT